MMSPLAVAQYVPKGSVHFDLCIIDEASQMPPESGLGALLRSEQTMVVGDTNQLPPSNFFKTVIDDEEADEDGAVLNKSILEMANATFRPARRLRWHYRSRHSGLIKFSNRLVYDDDLIVFPSAAEGMARMGVAYRSVDGRYKAGTNPTEAQAVIDAAVEFMRTDPDRSLGIVTLNQKQRDLIIEEFEFATSRHGHVQKYIEEWRERNDGLEEFFIKNLENVQGDERDVVFIGTVYGPEKSGSRVMQRFGPINGLAGKRRLNVLFTRAKEKIVTFSSMTAADIEADEHGNPGAYMLKRWLEYSATGVLDAGEQTVREPEFRPRSFCHRPDSRDGMHPNSAGGGRWLFYRHWYSTPRMAARILAWCGMRWRDTPFREVGPRPGQASATSARRSWLEAAPDLVNGLVQRSSKRGGASTDRNRRHACEFKLRACEFEGATKATRSPVPSQFKFRLL